MTSVPSLQRMARGPHGKPMNLGDTLTLETGLELTLVYVEDMIPIFRATPKGSEAEMWTNHRNYPGLYIWVGGWPSKPGPLDTDRALERALYARYSAETDFDLTSWVPFVSDHELAAEAA